MISDIIIIGVDFMARKRRMKKRKKFLIFILFLLLIFGGVFTYFYFFKEKNIIAKVKPIVKSLKIVDVNSLSRPIAVMIDNQDDAWPHAGLQDAYLSYEIIVEGGLTRIMAIFKDQDTDLIGPVRSSRHYFLDYAMENDAIYAHYGWSPQARKDISSYKINNLNGLYSDAFWRDNELYAPHNAFTNIKSILKASKDADYIRNTDTELLLNYSIDNINLDRKEGTILANNISIDYSYYHNTSYVYDADRKLYMRIMNNIDHVDKITGKQYTVKNIIVVKVDNFSMDDSGRQDIDNLGTGEGYYITNGQAVPIVWSKESRDIQTVYSYKNGKEIKVNDGNTFIHMMPFNQELLIT